MKDLISMNIGQVAVDQLDAAKVGTNILDNIAPFSTSNSTFSQLKSIEVFS